MSERTALTWSGRPACEKMVTTYDGNSSPTTHQCRRPQVKDGLCANHQPGAKEEWAKKRAERKAKKAMSEHKPLNALELAYEHDAYYDAPQAKEVAAMLRSQDAEIYRLRRERHHIYDLLARIHRDGGQYTAEHGVEKSCDDAEAQVVAWLDTINSVDALIEQARIAEREACAEVCEGLNATLPNTLKWAAERMRARGKS